MRTLKTILIILSASVILLLLLIASWAIWEHSRDPLSAIDVDAGSVLLLQDSIMELTSTPENRVYRHVILTTEQLGEIELSISQPAEIPTHGLPVIVVLGGLEIGEANFDLIEEPGNNIIAIYHYPQSPRYWYTGSGVMQIPEIRRAMLQVPAQLVTAIEWISRQDWVASEQICITGYSFGAMFLPAVYRLAESRQLLIQQGVIAYAGTGIQQLLAHNLHGIPAPFRSVFSWLAATAINPLEPTAHLPHLRNEFLLINGTRDHQIPERSWRTLHQLTPDPREIIILDEGHMHPSKPELTRMLVDMSQKWLLEKEAINP